VTSIGVQAFDSCSSLTSVYYTGDIASWCAIDFYNSTSVFYNSTSNPLCNGAELYIGGTLVTELIIPDSVTRIYDNAFYNCESLTSVVIPDSVTSIGDWAFRSCSSLTSVVIGNSVTSIGGKAFEGCSSLTSVVIPDSVTSISWNAFYGCSSLTSVEIGDSVTSIGDEAFYKCSSLTSISFNGTIAQWNAIKKGSNWKSYVPAKEVVCRDGVVAI